MGVAGFSVDGVTAGELEVERMPMGAAGLSVDEAFGVKLAAGLAAPKGEAGLSVEGGDIMLPGVAGFAAGDSGEVGDDEDGTALAAGRMGGAAGFDGTGDEGDGNLSFTVPAITAGGVERGGDCDASAGFGSCVMTICGLGVTASLPGAPGMGKFSL